MDKLGDMKKNQSDKGAAFVYYRKRSGLSGPQIAERLGLNNVQNLTHWGNRGVPAKKAVQVAALLGCRPDEISDIAIDAAQADEYTGYAAKKREVREALDAIVDGIDDPRLLDLILEQVRAVEKSFSK